MKGFIVEKKICTMIYLENMCYAINFNNINGLQNLTIYRNDP